MGKEFEFLVKAKPASLYRLLGRLTPAEGAIVLAGLPQMLVVQTLAFFPEETQTRMFELIVDAIRTTPELRHDVAVKIRSMLSAARKSRTAIAESPPATPVAVASGAETVAAETEDVESVITAPQEPAKSRQSMSLTAVNPYATAGKTYSQESEGSAVAYAPGAPSLGARLKKVVQTAQNNITAAISRKPENTAVGTVKPGTPTPWIPRTATVSPINGPAIPGMQPSVSGDPFTSPLAKAGLLDLIGRAQDKLLPKGSVARAENMAATRGATDKRSLPPREGVVPLTAVGFNSEPRLVGAGGHSRKRDHPVTVSAAASVRKMDGKAILAAILRAAGPEVREHVQEDDPTLYKELHHRMFYFDDLVYSGDVSLARVFTAAPVEVAALALRFAAPQLRSRVLATVSPGRARALKEASPARAGMEAVEAAQKKVLGVALQLQAAGRILIDPRNPDLAD